MMSTGMELSSTSLLQWLPSSPLTFDTTLLLSFIAIFITYHLAAGRGRRGKLPPPPPSAAGAWPLMGHMHLLGGSESGHAILGKMADKYGPAFTLNVGVNKQLIVSSNEVLRECFAATGDRSLSDRPIPLGIKHIFYDKYSFGFTPYGDYWREVRKLSMVNLLSNHCVEMFKPTRTSQINIWFKKLREMCIPNTSSPVDNNIVKGENPENRGQALVEMKSWLDEMVFNALINIIVQPKPTLSNAKDGNNEHERLVKSYHEATEELGQLLSCVAFSDLVPYLGWVDHLTGLVSRMKRNAKAFDSVLNVWLEQHKSNASKRKQNMATGHGDDEMPIEEQENGFVGKLLSMVAGSDVLGGEDHDVIIKSTMQVLIFGGSHSTAATLTWAVALLLNNRHVFRKAQEELDEVVGKDRLVEDSDFTNLVYLQAILKETMRLYPAGPITERIFKEDATVGGFHVKAGTGLWVNLAKVQRDPKVWSEPLEFKPERFLNEKADVVDFVSAKSLELIPFGMGRRICPAVTFSVRFMLLVLARLIQSFEMNTAQADADVDMTETPGFSLYKATPIEVIVSPRLDSKFYC